MTNTIGIAHYDVEPGIETLTTGTHEGRVIVRVEAHGRGVQFMLPPDNARALARQLDENALLLLGPKADGEGTRSRPGGTAPIREPASARAPRRVGRPMKSRSWRSMRTTALT